MKLLTVSGLLNKFAAVAVRSHRVKTLNKIPGPRQLPVIGNALMFGPTGPYKAEKIHEAAADLNRKYGPIVSLKLGIDMVFLFDPRDVELVFRNEDRFPRRPPMEALLKYRASSDKYLRMGLFTDHGQNWAYIRRLVNPLLKADVIHSYLQSQNEVAAEFVEYLNELTNTNGYVTDMMPELYKYTQEAIGVICFDSRLGCFKQDSSIENDMNQHVVDTQLAMGKTMLGLPLWKIYPTSTYRMLTSTQEAIRKITIKLLEKTKRDRDNVTQLTDGNTYLSSLMATKDLDVRDLNLIVLEIFQSGIDATASSIGLTLYHLCRNPKVQDKLVAELDSVCPKGTSVTPAVLERLTYLRACIKESLRLTSPSGGSARILSKNLVLSGYDVPAGVMVIGHHPVMSCHHAYVPEPLSFMPERWLRGGANNTHTVPPFVSLPFGFGARSCPGRRIAEQEMFVFFVQFFCKFKCEYHGPDIGLTMRMNFLPDKPLHFRFVKRQTS